MKKKTDMLIAAPLLLTLLFSCRKQYILPLKPGDAVPAFSVATSNGRTLTEKDLTGKTSVLVFFNTWCPDCIEELPEIDKLQAQNPEAFFLCICRGEDLETVTSFWNKHSLTMEYAIDSKKEIYHSFAGYPGTGVPLTCIIDKDGLVKALIIGNNNDIKTYLN